MSYLKLLYTANSSGLINWVEIGQVINNNQSTYTFNRVSGESNENVWPSKFENACCILSKDITRK